MLKLLNLSLDFEHKVFSLLLLSTVLGHFVLHDANLSLSLVYRKLVGITLVADVEGLDAEILESYLVHFCVL